MNRLQKHRLIWHVTIMAVIFVSAWIVSHNWYQIMLIQGNSMTPAYHNLQFVLLRKSFDREDVKKGDVIAFYCEMLDEVLVKRVIATQDDVVFISEGTLYVDGDISPFYENTVFEYAGSLGRAVTVQEKEFLVLGDNVAESKDSRYSEVGAVKFEDIIGIVL